MIPPSTFMEYGGGRILVEQLLPSGCYHCRAFATGRRDRRVDIPAAVLDAVYLRQNPRAPWATRPPTPPPAEPPLDLRALGDADLRLLRPPAIDGPSAANNDPVTSHIAAANPAVVRASVLYARRIIVWLRTQGGGCATEYEFVHHNGLEKKRACISSRWSELARDGLLEKRLDDGGKPLRRANPPLYRFTAELWFLTQRGWECDPATITSSKSARGRRLAG